MSIDEIEYQGKNRITTMLKCWDGDEKFFAESEHMEEKIDLLIDKLNEIAREVNKMEEKEMVKQIKRLQLQIKNLEEAMEKMYLCASVMKNVVEEATGEDIDKLIEESDE